jgi:uncharacterized protein YjbI with pentapeptide repeats
MSWTSPHTLLVAGTINYVTRKPEGLWSNVLVLPSFDIGDRLKFNAESKFALSPEAVSLRGRRLEGAVFVDAHLRKADFTSSELARADFRAADLREAKFECAPAGNGSDICSRPRGASFFRAQLQGASLVGAQLQGASLGNAQLQGASLRGAQLQGASLVNAQLQGAWLAYAQLQGAILDGAGLQGASLDWAHLEGAWLSRAQLQGASLWRAQLQGAILDGAELETASLNSVFVWRTAPPLREYLKSALIEMPRPEPKYACASAEEVCHWDDVWYAALKERIETVPEAFLRDAALKLIEPLGKQPYEEDAASAQEWRDLAAESQRSAKTYPGELAKALIMIGCGASGAPYVIGGLVQQLDGRFGDNLAQKAKVARAFLDEAKCPGAKGLSAENKARLREMRWPEPPQPNPGTASR